VVPAHGTRFRRAFAGALMDGRTSVLSASAHGNGDTEHRTQQDQHAPEREEPAKPVPGRVRHGLQ
jgi:hypothetical protein